MTNGNAWKPVGIDTPLEAQPTRIVPAPVAGKLEVLPTDELLWEDFERLLWRILRDVEGLRDAHFYGERGQAQDGIDLVAFDPRGEGVAIQSKRYAKFYPSQLAKAIDAFRTTQRPFDVERLIVAVACQADGRKLVGAIPGVKRLLAPTTFELWTKRTISDLLRDQPEIVIEFFGEQTAERFCLEFFRPIPVPAPQAVAVADAYGRTPEMQTGARALLDQATTLKQTDAQQAVRLIEEAQSLLELAGFHAHAAAHEPKRTELLAELGRGAEAAHSLLDEVWRALDAGRTTTARLLIQRLQELHTATAGDASVQDDVGVTIRVAKIAHSLHTHPLGPESAAASYLVGSDLDKARLLAVAAESAVALDDVDWLITAQDALQEAVDLTPTSEAMLLVRLRILHAEASGEWSALLGDARRRRLEYRATALVKARYARHLALRQNFRDADNELDEAIADACLAEHWQDAATWALTRRALRTRWQPFTGNELLAMETSLTDLGPSPRALHRDPHALEHAREYLADGKKRPAAIAAQRALRDAVASVDWVNELRARRLLGKIYAESGEPLRAAHQFGRSGHMESVKVLVEAFPDTFIDNLDDLSATNYWTVAFVYLLTEAQADVVPDRAVGRVSRQILDDLDLAAEGKLIDLVGFTTSRHHTAIKALAAMAERLPPEAAEKALEYFEAQPPVEPNHHRFHDDAEARLVAGIGSTHPGLVERAVDHLIPLLARSESARRTPASNFIENHLDLAAPRLAGLTASGQRWASEVLAAHDPTRVMVEAAASALERLTTPLVHAPGVFTVGTGAVSDSLLLRSRQADELEPVVSELLARSRDVNVGSGDRRDYLLAASNLVDLLPAETRRSFFARALECVTKPARSIPDEQNLVFSHPLGGVLVTGHGDSRPQASYLAARLASTAEQRGLAKNAAFALLGTEQRSDYWIARALQVVQDDLKDDLGFLAGQGWACRALAAITWVHDGEPLHLGETLARDPDVRVRRSLASEVGQRDASHLDDVRQLLRLDIHHSVRTALVTPTSDGTGPDPSVAPLV